MSQIFEKITGFYVRKEILKSKFNLIPIIKKNFDVKNFKINKEYKLNENLEE